VETEDQNEDFQRLHQLITGTKDIKGFLDGMTRYASTTMTLATGERVECAVTLWRRKRSMTIAGSSDTAILLDGVEQALGDGPCVEALETLAPVLLADTAVENRWPEYSKSLAAAGARSVLGVPLALGKDAAAALNFFAPATGLFTAETIEEAAIFGDMAGQALRLALRLVAAELLAEDLRSAMQTRAVIDVACGMIMEQNQCTQEEAFEFIAQASQHRNQKVHDVAASIIRRHSGSSGTTTTHFQD
jgi:GAF domain-containing protein